MQSSILGVTSETGLSALFRNATQAAHKNVEAGLFIKKIFSGAVTREEYHLYSQALAGLYGALEKSLGENREHPGVSRIYFPELLRCEPLHQDLKEWHGAETRLPASLKREIEEIRGYLEQLGQQDPLLLVAHAYVRYLGDLSGGQALARGLARRFPEERGFSFYAFPKVGNLDAMKNLYRQRLDEIGRLNPDRCAALAQEAVDAFELNNRLFSAILSDEPVP